MSIEIDQVQTAEPIKNNVEPEPEDIKNVQPEPVNQDQPEPEPDYNPELEHELQVKLQPILLDSAINALGNTLEKLTSNQDMNFDENEHKALVEAWTPLLPSVSPMTNAILVTVIILSGKALLYTAYKKKSKPTDTKPLPVNSEVVKEAID